MAVSALRPIVCDLSALGDGDVQVIDLLGRLELAARRHGGTLRLRNASPALAALIAYVGLDAVLCLELEREPEEREDPLGVEEEGQLDDPAA
ncbi:MAG: STAS domain-containing protein [Gaiellaceae bacterium]